MQVGPIVLIFSTLVGIIAAGIYYLISDQNGARAFGIFNNVFFQYAPNIDGLEFDDNDYPWRRHLRDHYLEIKQEFLEYTAMNYLPRYDSIDPVQWPIDSAVQPHIPWEVLILQMFGRRSEKVKYFPKTYNLLSNLPGRTVTLALFSVLHAGKHLTAHVGPYKGVIRYHLCILAPKNKRVSYVRVNSKRRNYEESKDIIFDDTYLHEVKNLSRNESRVVLFVDIKRDFKHFIPNMMNEFFLFVARFHGRVIEVTKLQDEMNSSKSI